MPTNLLHTANSFKQEDVIHATAAGLLSPRALTIDATKIAADEDAQKVIRPGLILYKITGAEKHRVGLRTTLDQAVTASSTTAIELAEFGQNYQSQSAQYFAPGDVLKVLRPYSFVTLSNTWDTDDTLAVVIDGQSITYTPGSATLATGAAAVAAEINANPYHSQLVEAIADGPVIYIFSKSRRAYSLSVTATTTGDGTASAAASSLVGDTTIGTIDTDGISIANGTVTLAAAAAVTLPSGAPVGVEGTPWGLIMGAYDAAKSDTDVTGFTGGAVYGDRIPYWDDDIKMAMPQITFV